MANRYFGIENEFTTFKRGKLVDFNTYFPQFKRQFQCIERSQHSIRAHTGHAYYVDGHELELCTPPIKQRQGFATSLAESLRSGREKILDFTDAEGLIMTGYSMHWNLTIDPFLEPNTMNATGTVAKLFGCTPLSRGVGMRVKGNSRLEILTDTVQDYDLIRATALLLAATHHAVTDRQLHIEAEYDRNDGSFRDGRYGSSIVRVQSRSGRGGSHALNMSNQEYLERLVEHIEPILDTLGTSEEKSIVYDFVNGTRKLPVDKQKLYALLAIKGVYDNGVWKPHQTASGETTQLQRHPQIAPTPLEDRIWGSLAAAPPPEIDIGWESLSYRDGNNRVEASTLDGVYRILERRTGLTLPGGNRQRIETKPIELITKKNMSYTENDDTSADLSELENEINHWAIVGKTVRSQMSNLAMSAVFAAAVYFVAGTIASIIAYNVGAYKAELAFEPAAAIETAAQRGSQ